MVACCGCSGGGCGAATGSDIGLDSVVGAAEGGSDPAEVGSSFFGSEVCSFLSFRVAGTVSSSSSCAIAPGAFSFVVVGAATVAGGAATGSLTGTDTDGAVGAVGCAADRSPVAGGGAGVADDVPEFAAGTFSTGFGVSVRFGGALAGLASGSLGGGVGVGTVALGIAGAGAAVEIG